MNITVYCGSHPGNDPIYMEAAEELGTWIGQSGNTLVYGGSSVGLMGMISRSVLDNGGCVEGVEPRFFIDAGVAQHDLTELIVVDTMNERKAKMIELGDVFVAMPGGIGTLEEIAEIMCRVRLNISPAPCFLLNLNGFYDPMIALLDKMDEAGFMPEFDRGDYRFPATVAELIAEIEKLPEDRACCSEYHWIQPEWVSSESSY